MNNNGKVALVTGATSGIGGATAKRLAEEGFEVFFVCRNADKGATLQDELRQSTGNPEVHMIVADLDRLADVQAAGEAFLATGKPLHLLVNNAGVTNTSRIVNGDGFEQMFAVNHLAYYLLTEILRDRIIESAPARIVSVSSGAHAFVDGVNFDDLQYEKGFSTFKVYGHSKLCNILWTRELARQLEGTGVTANCVHPGAVATGLGTQNGWFGKFAQWILKPFFQSPEKGASTTLYCALSDEVGGVTGQYFANCKVKQPKPWARDDEAARRLWEETSRLVNTALAANPG